MGNRELLLLLSLGRASEEGFPAELPELAVVGAGPVPHLVGGQVLHAAGPVLAARHRGQARHRGHLQQQRLEWRDLRHLITNMFGIRENISYVKKPF